VSGELDTVRERVMQLLKQEGRAMHTGEIAARLAIPTHQVHSAMHIPLQRREAWFASSKGYSLPPTDPRRVVADDSQQTID
jgi:hypothetical protein